MVRGKVKNAGPTMVEICDELEPLLESALFTDTAPFQTISLIIRYGESAAPTPVIGRLDRYNKELQVSVQLSMEDLKKADAAAVKAQFMEAAVRALVHAGERYDLPNELLQQQFAEHGIIIPEE